MNPHSPSAKSMAPIRASSRPNGRWPGPASLLACCTLLLAMSAGLPHRAAARLHTLPTDSLRLLAPSRAHWSASFAAPGTYPMPRPVSPPGSDRWLARDKLKHLTFSVLWTLGAQYVLVQKAGWSERDALPLAVGSGAAVGVSKELFDAHLGPPPRRFSTRDLVADAVGLLLATGLILL